MNTNLFSQVLKESTGQKNCFQSGGCLRMIYTQIYQFCMTQILPLMYADIFMIVLMITDNAQWKTSQVKDEWKMSSVKLKNNSPTHVYQHFSTTKQFYEWVRWWKSVVGIREGKDHYGSYSYTMWLRNKFCFRQNPRIKAIIFYSNSWFCEQNYSRASQLHIQSQLYPV